MIKREDAIKTAEEITGHLYSQEAVDTQELIHDIYDSIDEELEAREKNTARIRKRRDELYEELRRYRQEYTEAKQKIDSIGTCESCKYSKQSRTFSLKPIKDRFDCSYLSLQMKPKGFYCGDFEGKQ